MNDGEIIELLLKRDGAALNAIAERYGGLCRSLMRNILRDEREHKGLLGRIRGALHIHGSRLGG